MSHMTHDDFISQPRKRSECISAIRMQIHSRARTKLEAGAATERSTLSVKGFSLSA
jgi:hypothetical protein